MFEWIDCGKEIFYHNENGKIVASVYQITDNRWSAFNKSNNTLEHYSTKNRACRAIEKYFKTYV